MFWENICSMETRQSDIKNLLLDNPEFTWRDNYIKRALRFWELLAMKSSEDDAKKYEEMGTGNLYTYDRKWGKSSCWETMTKEVVWAAEEKHM